MKVKKLLKKVLMPNIISYFIFAIVVFPKLVAVYYPDVAVTIGYTSWSPGFLFFKEGREVFEWVTFQGLVITQLDTNLVSAIIGMYFGGSLAKGK